MLQKLKDRRSEAGFTLVELLIVIVVIAILAAIVINTFAGVQARARDTERQTDVKALASQLEVYYTNEGVYPTETVMTGAASGITTILEGLSPDALTDPQGADADDNHITTTTPTATSKTYSYNCTGSGTPAACTSFRLQYWSESQSTPGVVISNSLSN